MQSWTAPQGAEGNKGGFVTLPVGAVIGLMRGCTSWAAPLSMTMTGRPCQILTSLMVVARRPAVPVSCQQPLGAQTITMQFVAA